MIKEMEIVESKNKYTMKDLLEIEKEIGYKLDSIDIEFLLGKHTINEALTYTATKLYKTWQETKKEYNLTEEKIQHIYQCMVLDGYKNNDKTNVVYFIKNEYTGLIKIGQTKNISKRIISLIGNFKLLGMNPQKLQLVGLIYCPYGTEKKMIEKEWHEKLKKNQIVGEWFKVKTEEVQEMIYKYSDIHQKFVQDMGVFDDNIAIVIANTEMYKPILAPKIIEDDIEIMKQWLIENCFHNNSFSLERVIELCRLEKYIQGTEIINSYNYIYCTPIEIMYDNVWNIVEPFIIG